MKYTFEKFKIQLVTKPTQILQKNHRYSQAPRKNSAINRRQIKTAQYSHRKSNHLNEQEMVTKTAFEEHYPNNEVINMTRSQSLQTQVKERCKDWLNFSNLSNTQRQKQYRIFQQKCIDLLSKKKRNTDSQKKYKLKNVINKSNKLFFGQLQHRNGTKQKSVQSMMNNIIQRFKQDSRLKNYNQKQKQKYEFINTLKSSPDRGSFFTIKNQFSKFSDKNLDSMSKQQQSQIFKFIKSTQLKRNYSQQNNTAAHVQNQIKSQIQQKINKFNQRYQKQWKEVPDITGVRVNKKLFKQQYPRINPVVCTSISLNQPNKDLRKSLLAMEHIKLSPYSQAVSTAVSTSKRKKIHLNKPSNLKKFMKFTKNTSDQQYNKKIKAYLDFLFKINFSNNIYISLQLATLQQTITNSHKYKVYVGSGNNCLLIKSLLKRREWIKIVDNINQQGIQFYWTQNKIHQIHSQQQKCQNYKQNLIRNSMSSNHQRKKSSFKTTNQIKQLNSKILPAKKAQIIEQYIFEDGYQIPFQKDYQVNIVTNHVPQNYVIGSKKNLFKSMYSYYTNIVKKDPFTVIPKTYHIKSYQDPQFKRFVRQNSKQPTKLWIVKPGQNTNRGTGIKLCKFQKIQSLIKQKIKHPNGHLMTYIVQSYINKPFLYNGRKFDIRHYMLITTVNGVMKVYWYRDGYIRTSSQFYDIDQPDNQFIHLTNDAIQMKGQSYGKYEDANKLSYSQFQRYLDYSFTGKGYNIQNIIKQMKLIILDVVKATYMNIDKERKKDNFQLFGFDFMIDRDFKPYLIQINFNPCLVVNCNVLNRIIPPLIENTLRVGLDPLLTPKNHLAVNKRNNLSQNYLKNLRYQLIFDQTTIEADIYNKADIRDSDDQEQQYCDNGKELPQNVIF